MSKLARHDGRTVQRRAASERRAHTDEKGAAGRRAAPPDKPPRPPAGGDPYNQGGQASRQVPRAGRQRSLDDMRRLSEAIKTTPNWTPPKRSSHGAVYKRLALMRGALERTLAELLSVIEGSAQLSDREAVSLVSQLRAAAYHLESSIDYLKPLGD